MREVCLATSRPASSIVARERVAEPARVRRGVRQSADNSGMSSNGLPSRVGRDDAAPDE
jgi:hypothetical protein